MATIQVRVSDKNKKNVEKILASLGLDVTTAVRMFLCRIEMDHGLPFAVQQKLTVNGFTPEFEAEVLRAAKEDELSPAFDSAEDAIAYLHSLDPSSKRK
jgi:DNA-damage-inducible protein J